MIFCCTVLPCVWNGCLVVRVQYVSACTSAPGNTSTKYLLLHIFSANLQAEKRKYAGPDASQTLKGGISVAERDAHRVENRLQQVGDFLFFPISLFSESDRIRTQTEAVPWTLDWIMHFTNMFKFVSVYVLFSEGAKQLMYTHTDKTG